jgi:hypothetical protein
VDRGESLEELVRGWRQHAPDLLLHDPGGGAEALVRRGELLVTAEHAPRELPRLRRWVEEVHHHEGLQIARARLRGSERDRCVEIAGDRGAGVAANHVHIGSAVLRGSPVMFGTGADVRDCPAIPAPAEQLWEPPVLVGVLDTGLDPHPWFAGRPWFREVREELDADDDSGQDRQAGHGTFVAGLVLQRAPGAALRPCRALSSLGFTDDVGVARVRPAGRRGGRDLGMPDAGRRVPSRAARGAARRRGGGRGRRQPRETTCADHGWPAPAAELWLTAGRSAHQAGLRSASRELLARAAASGEQGLATAPQRVVGWLARALLAQQDGDPDGVFEACGQGLRTVDTYAAAIPAYELRVQAFGLAEELAATAVGQALRLGDPRAVLRWTERARASALSRRLPHPPEDEELREALVELRAAVAADRGGGDRRAEILELEDRVRQRAMLVDGAVAGEHQRRGFEQLRARLGRAVLVSMFGHDGQLHVLSIVDGRVRLRVVGPEKDVQSQVDGLRHLLARQVCARPGHVRDVFAGALAEVAETVEQQLLGDLRAELEPDRPLVVVPTGRLHALPWAALSCCRGRSVTVAPSLRCWLRAADDARLARGNAERVWVAGPRLEHAEREVRALHGESGGELITGADAAVEAVLAAADGAGTVHIAAHGEFRDDQPLLSALELADGPLYGYDLDRLHRGPAIVVLSACEVGRSAVSRGDELSGLATALLGRGTATVIASIVPVSDERAAEVMLALHAGLRRGLSPAQALAAAQREHGETGFLCFGHGGDP